MVRSKPSPEPAIDDDIPVDVSYEWQMLMFGQLGFDEYECVLLAERPGVSWHDADRMLRGGCRLDQVLNILL